jgi:thiosulfate dehydrogenase [quinone] large subunit
MTKKQHIALLLLRLGMGWLFFYAGITKILDAGWTAQGYIANAFTFPDLFAWFATPANIGWVSFLNEWGLLLIGVALILGIFVRYASYAGIVLMTLYWLPILQFPYVGGHSYIVDEHIMYVLLFFILSTFNAGRYWGLEKFFPNIR